MWVSCDITRVPFLPAHSGNRIPAHTGTILPRATRESYFTRMLVPFFPALLGNPISREAYLHRHQSLSHARAASEAAGLKKMRNKIKRSCLLIHTGISYNFRNYIFCKTYLRTHAKIKKRSINSTQIITASKHLLPKLAMNNRENRKMFIANNTI